MAARYISVQTELPPKDKPEWSFSKDVKVKCGNKTGIAYYHWKDLKWYTREHPLDTDNFHYRELKNVTHWKPILNPHNQH